MSPGVWGALNAAFFGALGWGVSFFLVPSRFSIFGQADRWVPSFTLALFGAGEAVYKWKRSQAYYEEAAGGERATDGDEARG